jgi:NADH-quinone oxidoreductase subunit C
MAEPIETLATKVQERFAGMAERCALALGEITLQIPRGSVTDVCLALRDEPDFRFDMLVDLCGVDYQGYGEGGWTGPRFAVVYHLLSLAHNRRIRVKAFLDDQYPRVATVVPLWEAANWFEREAFDLYGILFEGHPDLRRLLTDYGFIGHPFRKDFPLWGNVQMRYDPEKGRVIYEPVTIEPRITVPRVIRQDSRYLVDTKGAVRG